jgi:pimeloyl-ACP methyl ester carboxylesterase
MAKSEETAELLAAAQSEKAGVTVIRRKKDRSDKLRRDGMQHGSGANVFFYKAMYNRFRFAHFGIFTKTSETYLFAAVAVSVLCRFVIQAEGMRGLDMTDQLDQIQCPMLAIGDRQDHVLGGTATEKIGDYMSENADFQLYMYDGYGHAVYDLAPDIKERMKDFLMQ